MSLGKIVRTELLKLPRMANYILLGILLLLNLGFTIVFINQLGFSTNNPSVVYFGEQLISIITSISNLLIAIFIIMNVGKEYSDGTLRKNIIDGFARDEFYLGKVFVLILCVLIAFLLGMLSLLIYGLGVGQLGELMDTMKPTFIINFFIDIFYTGLFSFFLIFLFKRIGIGLVAYFLWGTIEKLIVGAQSIYAQVKDIELWVRLEEYLPLSSFNLALSSGEIIGHQALIVSACYVLLMFILPYYLFLKADIKS